MDWLFDNLQLVVIVASAFAWWWSQRREGQGEDEQQDEPRQQDTTTVFEELERSRRIQEEIRRKIAERRGGAAPAQREVSREMPEPYAEPPPLVVPPLSAETPWEVDRSALERQHQLEERMRELEAQRAAARAAARSAEFPKAATATPSGGRSVARSERDWLQSLRDPRSVRQAVVLREVLGPPAAFK